MLRIFSVSVLAAALLSGCASKAIDGKPHYPKSHITVKYRIRHFDIDISKSFDRLGKRMLPEEQGKALARQYLDTRLQDEGLLASQDDLNVVDLDIFIDYHQRFVGDKTPFPVDKMVNPTMQFFTKHYLGDEMLEQDISPVFDPQNLNNFISGVPLNGMFTDDSKLEYRYLSATVNNVIEYIQADRQYDANAFAFKTKGLDKAAILAKRQARSEQAKAADIKPVGLTSADYIPAEINAPYIAGIKSTDRDQRIDTDKSLLKVWLYSDALYGLVQKQVLDNYQSSDPAAIEEATWAAKALALSGLEKYRPTVQLVADKGATEALQKYAKRYLLQMDYHSRLAKQIHDVSTMDPSLDWRGNQLSNMLRTGDDDQRMYAIKDIARNYGTNPYLLAQLSHILDTEARISRFRFQKQDNFYAWICRILGKSGNKSYQPLLEDIAAHGVYKKTRKYAEAFADKLAG
ncbi:hypothetical protein [Gallaecimonas pentaromativorans]|uniref:Uncharacterized protein n=1 Tax=Gallaecimonas pentaromativorans TaxID=584787 RepID=A0A3N1PN75_9GAMM|nr:hypothetical protein [Gallaecimonas pentaromativorans]ROQ25986.1 hypothetical protein EDC28_105306 [Gallaecimonas pentaromativorans]